MYQRVAGAVSAVSSLGLAPAAVFRTPLALELVSGAIGFLFSFFTDFSWPSEAMPEAIRFISILVPSTSAIDGFVRDQPARLRRSSMCKVISSPFGIGQSSALSR